MRNLILSASFALMAAILSSPSWAQGAASPKPAEAQAVRAIVLEFGKRLRSVAVLAQKDVAAAEIDQAYANLVAPDLLAAWKNKPEAAPGKLTSSPSPERIDITSVKPDGPEAYTVSGKVILLTDQERRSGGVFQANPVEITVARRQGEWAITKYGEKQGK